MISLLLAATLATSQIDTVINSSPVQTIEDRDVRFGVKETVDFDSREVATEEETKAYNEQVLEYNKKKANDDGITVTESK